MLKTRVLKDQERIFQNKRSNQPSIYESVIKSDRTMINNNPYFSNNNFNNNFENQMNQFIGQRPQNELERLDISRMSIPVKLEMSNRYLGNDQKFSNFENPIFLTKNKEEKKEPNTINLPKMPMINPALQAMSVRDVKLVKKQLQKANTKKLKLKACKKFL
jgi:hypothetical protein